MAVRWLLRGIKFAACLGMGGDGEGSSGTEGEGERIRVVENGPCFRHLVWVCHRTTLVLLEALVIFSSRLYEQQQPQQDGDGSGDNGASLKNESSILLQNTLCTTAAILHAITIDKPTTYLLVGNLTNQDGDDNDNDAQQ